MFRTRRQQRYAKLIVAGFLPFEARELSSVPFARAPYIRRMMMERIRIIRSVRQEAAFNKWSKTRYEHELRMVIAFEYKNKGLVIQKKKGHN